MEKYLAAEKVLLHVSIFIARQVKGSVLAVEILSKYNFKKIYRMKDGFSSREYEVAK